MQFAAQKRIPRERVGVKDVHSGYLGNPVGMSLSRNTRVAAE